MIVLRVKNGIKVLKRVVEVIFVKSCFDKKSKLDLVCFASLVKTLY